ncbi:MAG TPA: protein-glutamate O-methyltransferase CheR [Blastocatellia bacterium]|nr:protein-glutamate O-methyltransferase CheR [Blastocatellia bacterium]
MRETIGASEPEMLPHEREAWREFIRLRSGLFFPESRQRFMRRRLWDRMVQLGIGSYGEYYERVRFTNGEFTELLELLLNNETAFFRHQPLFDALTCRVLPEIMRAREGGGSRVVSMWSAGCSKGQEAYSIVMSFLEMPDTLGWTPRVVASDLSRRSLDHARRGRYRPHEMRLLPRDYQLKYVPAVSGGGTRVYEVSEKVRQLVEFTEANLADLSRFKEQNFDVISCQNVLIHFQAECRAQVARNLSDRLAPGGYLLLSPAEAIGLNITGMRTVLVKDAVIYQRPFETSSKTEYRGEIWAVK